MKKFTALLSALVLSACTQQTTKDVQSFSLGATEIRLPSPNKMTHLTEKDELAYQLFKQLQQADNRNHYFASYFDFQAASNGIIRYCAASIPKRGYYVSIKPEFFNELKSLINNGFIENNPEVIEYARKVSQHQTEVIDGNGQFIDIHFDSLDKVSESEFSSLVALVKTETYKENGKTLKDTEVTTLGVTLVKDKVIMLNCRGLPHEKQYIIDITDKWQKDVLRLNGY